MGTVGFLNLPTWQDYLRQALFHQDLQELLRAPVLGTEEVDRPWTSLEPDEFFPVVETGFHFADRRPPPQWPRQVVTSDAAAACRRFCEGMQTQTGVRGAIGGTYPILDIFHPSAGYPPPRRLLAMTDGIAGAVLSEMEQSGKSLEQALHEIQWRSLAPGNATRHLHGLVARDRLALLGSLVFGVNLNPEEIPAEGFGNVESRDMALARQFQLSIRLLGVVEKDDQGLTAWIRPVLLPSRYLLAQVRGGAEGAYLQMEEPAPKHLSPGPSSFFFSGAGTSPEVVLRGMIRDWKSLTAHGSFLVPEWQPRTLVDPGKIASGFYLRLTLVNFDTTVAQVLNLLADRGIGIKALYQPDAITGPAGGEPELIILTRPVPESHWQDTVREIREHVRLASVKAWYRHEG